MVIKINGKEVVLRSIREKELGDNEINVKESYFSVNKKVRKKHANLLEVNLKPPHFYIFLSNEIIEEGRRYNLSGVGTYPSRILFKRIGEGIFELKEEGINLYKIIHPRK